MAKKKPVVPKEIEFDYIKSNFFRVVRGDGAFGGLSPNGTIHMAIFSERSAIPTKIVHKVVDNALGPEIVPRREVRKAVVREVEVDVTLDINQAIALRKWLDDKIKAFHEAMGIPQAATNGSVK